MSTRARSPARRTQTRSCCWRRTQPGRASGRSAGSSLPYPAPGRAARGVGDYNENNRERQQDIARTSAGHCKNVSGTLREDDWHFLGYLGVFLQYFQTPRVRLHKPLRARLHLAIATLLRWRCNIAPKSNVCVRSCTVTYSICDCNCDCDTIGDRFMSDSRAMSLRFWSRSSSRCMYMAFKSVLCLPECASLYILPAHPYMCTLHKQGTEPTWMCLSLHPARSAIHGYPP